MPSVMKSNSRMKSPYSFVVARKELILLLVAVPTIMPSFAAYFAVPVTCFQPLRFFPLNKGSHSCAEARVARQASPNISANFFISYML